MRTNRSHVKLTAWWVYSSILILLAVFGFIFCGKWVKTVSSYLNVNYSWISDEEGYEVFLEDIRLTIEPKKATLVYLPSEDIKTIAVVIKEETILGWAPEYTLDKFCINIGWKGESK